MTTKFNFATEQSAVPFGYISDFGEAYSQERGYGWVQENDFSTPLDLTPNGRDRDLVENQLIDTLMHMQYPENSLEDVVRTPGAWQYNLFNGQYRVTIGVGDPFYEDSVHNINVEGENTIAGFVPNAENLFTKGTKVVTVTDGQLTVDAVGGENTKLNYIEITPLSSTLINFGLSDSPAPGNAIKDFGQAYSEARGYGWVQESDLSIPLDITPNGRDRELVEDQLIDTLMHMQYPDNSLEDAVRTPAAWEYDLPNGEYQVQVGVGDAAYLDSSHVINIEGVNVINGFIPMGGNIFIETYKTVEVTDGKLTIDAIGGENTKLNYVSIAPVIDVKVNFGSVEVINVPDPLPETEYPEGYELDFGDAYSDIKGYGWITQESVGESNSTPIDITGNARERNLVDDYVADTLIHMQYPEEIENETANKTAAAWEYDLPNGFYEVTVSVGDAAFTDSIHVVNIEGIETISGFVPSSDQLFTTATNTVEVTDGKLTIDAIGGENTKLNFIEIASSDI
jgi:phage baseplate assembly protein gpV